MYIGILEQSKITKINHMNSAVPFSKAVKNGDSYSVNWQDIFDTGIDLIVDLTKECFVGAVTVPMSQNSLYSSIEILTGGKMVARHDAETGGLCGGEVNIPVGVWCDDFTVRIHANLKSIEFKEPVVFGAYEDKNSFVWPAPKKIDCGEGFVKIKETVTNGHEDELFAKEYLDDRLKYSFPATDKDGTQLKISLTDDSQLGDEGYRLSVSDDGILLEANTRIALLYGVDTLIQILEENGFRKCKILDKPTQKLRGFHAGLPSRDNFEFARRFLRYVLIPLRYNTLFIEFNGGMKFDRHPLISEKFAEANKLAKEGKIPPFPHGDMGADGEPLEKSEVRTYLDYAEELGLEIIPEIQSFGHVQYITNAYPEIAEICEEEQEATDTRKADARPDSYYYHSYCPQNPKSYEIIFDIIDEILEVVKPKRYVHMGHDEIYQIGLCKKCSKIPKDELYAAHVNKLHDYLKEKGLGMMIWADMLHDTNYPEVAPAIEKIYKDVILLDFIWYFHFDKDIEDQLLPHGFKVAIGNLYSSHFPRYESRICKKNIIGGQCSTWTKFNEETFALNGKFYDLIYLSNMLWNSEKYMHELRPVYNEFISKKIQPTVRELMYGVLTHKKFKLTRLDGMRGDTERIPAELLRILPEARVVSEGEIAVNACYDRITFSHAALNCAKNVAWVHSEKLGQYIITFEDGEKEVLPIYFDEQIGPWNRVYAAPKPQQYYRHTGYPATWYSDPVITEKTDTGRDITVYGYVWYNKTPQRKIKKIKYVQEKNDYVGLILFSVDGEKMQKDR